MVTPRHKWFRQNRTLLTTYLRLENKLTDQSIALHSPFVENGFIRRRTNLPFFGLVYNWYSRSRTCSGKPTHNICLSEPLAPIMKFPTRDNRPVGVRSFVKNAKNRIQCRPICSSVTWKPFKISSWNIIEILTNIRWCADRKNHNSWIYICLVMPLWTLAMPENRIQCRPLCSSVTWKPFKISSWNVT